MKYQYIFILMIAYSFPIIGQDDCHYIDYVYKGQKGNYFTSYGKYGGTKSKKAQDHFLHGMYYLSKDMNDSALIFYNKSLKADNKFLEAYDFIAFIYHERKDFEKELEYYDRILKIRPTAIMANKDRDYALRMINDKKNFYANIEKKKAEPESDMKNYSLALYYMGIPNYEEAIKYANLGLQLSKVTNKHEGMGYTILVKCFLKLGNIAIAKEYWKIGTANGRKLDDELEKEMSKY